MSSAVLSESAANSYDAVPYKDYPYSFTHPRHLEAMGTLFGMTPPDITCCRVLELGCAGGGNLIPQAVDLPGSEFVGIDLSEVQVGHGRGIVNELGLRNIELRVENIMQVDASWGQFDYILCHGVFSWIPRPVQEKVFDICRDRLSPQGIAFISYNTYPGWHLAGVVRDIMKYHADQFDQPAKKIEQAKAILEFLVKTGGEEGTRSSLGMLFREELNKLRAAGDDSYIFHEHLEDHNEPMYFYQFMERASKHRLQYLGESDFTAMLVSNLPAEARDTLQSLPLLRQEQYMDFVRGCRFRKTLLCHDSVQLDRNICGPAIKNFFVALSGEIDTAEVDIRTERPARFIMQDKSQLTVTNRLAKAAMVRLKESFPAYTAFNDLYATALARATALRTASLEDGSARPDTLADCLLLALTVGMLRIAVHPPRCVVRPCDRPVANALVRRQSTSAALLTNELHEPVNVDRLGRWVLARLDGRHSRADLACRFQDALANGSLALSVGDEALTSTSSKAITGLLESTLGSLARQALLRSMD
ncbi:MAG: methyltransferase regulatory domain-containing protein [Planctomycetota bacterium]